MKVERAGGPRATRSIGATGYTRRGEAVESAIAVAPVSATVLGIPEEEFTPRVRDAIMTLMGEVDSLRREVQQARQLLSEMEQVADRDQLLPVLNRRAFVRELTRYISFAVRYGTPASLLYFDLDGFKLINDSHGHSAGDAVLEHFAQKLLANVRDSDVVGRLGGDEFGVILTHANHAQAQAKAAALAGSLNNSPASWQGRDIPVGFSFGAFELTSGDSADLAIARADEAMYAHKRNAAVRR
ncbi:MAG TPA: GGDEF domain-containing protein [Rhizomicrobium sp.]